MSNNSKAQTISESDHLVKAITINNSFRAIALSTRDLTEEARQRHNLSHTATVALGRVMACGFLLCYTLKKTKGHLTLKFRGDGPLGRIVVDVSNEGTIRGYISNPQVEVFDKKGYVDIDKAIGKTGYVHVIYETEVGLPHQGTVEIVSGEVASDVVNYLARSEQIPSFISCGVYLDPKSGKVLHAGGILIQALPDASEEDLKNVEETVSKLDPYSILLRSGLNVEKIIKKALLDFDVKILSEFEGLCFHCGCSQKKFEDAIFTLDKEEIKKIIDTTGYAEGICHFCNNVYLIQEDNLKFYLK